MRNLIKVFLCLMTVCAGFLSATNTDGFFSKNCKGTEENQTAFVGGSVSISCKYPPTEENTTWYFCKDSLTCRNISSEGSSQKMQDRFSLMDDEQQEIYTVTISNLTQDDSGSYWCATKSLKDGFISCLSEVHLHIFKLNDLKPVKMDLVASEMNKISCNYTESLKESEKLLCKGDTLEDCVELIQTTGDEGRVKGRFYIKDNRRTNSFYVYIRHMSPADSGTYWCVCGRAQFTKIQLSVAGIKTKRQSPRDTGSGGEKCLHDTSHHTCKNILCTNKLLVVASITTCAMVHLSDHGTGQQVGLCQPDGCHYLRCPPPDTQVPEPEPGVIAGIVVGLLCLLMVVITLILCRRRLFQKSECCTSGESSDQRTASNTEDNNDNHNYEEIQLQNQQKKSDLPTVYATISPPADQMQYASVDFQKNITDKKDASEQKHVGKDEARPPAETTLYSTVAK
ncbi:CMRF35-like molecule 8 [Nothobranchius furzeri]|uniref:CMRF35-like molecule 8 n=1 Tax=Nothobranchius furzeri TaxID=105023 RepID=UPI0039047C93